MMIVIYSMVRDFH